MSSYYNVLFKKNHSLIFRELKLFKFGWISRNGRVRERVIWIIWWWANWVPCRRN